MIPTPLLLFIGVLLFFHSSEFILACIYMRDDLSLRSLLVSKPYAVAMGCALLEYAVESSVAPRLKVEDGGMGPVSWAGLALVMFGEVVRKVGMVTAQSNFTHNIRMERHPTHKLVTGGIYRYVRHPGYLGWYVWCIGTSMLLANPVTCVAFAYVAWRFFESRIQIEEYYLRQFFGPEYEAYAARTPTWIPFIP